MRAILERLQAVGVATSEMSDKFVLTLPMYYTDGDPIELYLKHRDGKWILSDEGFIDVYHNYRHELGITGFRTEYINFICRTYHFGQHRGTKEYYKVTNLELLVNDVWIFGQGLHSLADLVNHAHSKAKKKTQLVEEAKSWFAENFRHESLSAHLNYTFTDAEDDKINACDIVLNSNPDIKPIVIEVVPSVERASEAFEVFVHHRFIKRRSIKCVVIFNDYESIQFSSTKVKRLMNIGAQTFNDVRTVYERIEDLIEPARN